MPARYAVYFVPRRETPLGSFGARWLAGDGDLAGLDPSLHRRITAKPRGYGYHATLKAPFRLAGRQTEEALIEALVSFADARPSPRPFDLALRDISGFLALVPAGAAADVAALAQACVEAFEPFRAAPSDEELARRRAGGLTERQEANLLRWGYPYVAEDFRFHMTLTDRLTQEERQAVEPVLAGLVQPLIETPLKIDAISLVKQDEPQADFAALRRFALTG